LYATDDVSTFFLALGLSLLGGLGGLLVASSVLLIKDSARTRIIPWLVSYAVGALLGAAMLKILPEAVEQVAPARLFATLLVGVMLFFILEKLPPWTSQSCV
jgi:zinc and cadmium transporter